MKTFDFHAAIPRVATRTKKFTPLLNTSMKVTNLPAVELLRMLLPHYMKTMSDGGILKKRIQSLIQVLQPELYIILISNPRPAITASPSSSCCISTLCCFRFT